MGLVSGGRRTWRKAEVTGLSTDPPSIIEGTLATQSTMVSMRPCIPSVVYSSFNSGQLSATSSAAVTTTVIDNADFTTGPSRGTDGGKQIYRSFRGGGAEMEASVQDTSSGDNGVESCLNEFKDRLSLEDPATVLINSCSTSSDGGMIFSTGMY
jgi:hypothetical protein